MKYYNIVSQYFDFRNYAVIAEYEEKEDAIKNYKNDVAGWIRQNKNKTFYIMNPRPFSYATIGEKENDRI